MPPSTLFAGVSFSLDNALCLYPTSRRLASLHSRIKFPGGVFRLYVSQVRAMQKFGNQGSPFKVSLTATRDTVSHAAKVPAELRAQPTDGYANSRRKRNASQSSLVRLALTELRLARDGLFSSGNYRSLEPPIVIIGLTSRRPGLAYSIRFSTLSVIPFEPAAILREERSSPVPRRNDYTRLTFAATPRSFRVAREFLIIPGDFSVKVAGVLGFS